MKKQQYFITVILETVVAVLLIADVSFSSEFQDYLYDKLNIESSGFLETRYGRRLARRCIFL